MAPRFSAHDVRASRLSRSGRLPWLDATHGPVARNLRALFLPILVGILCQQGALAVHALFLGKTGIVETEAIHAIGNLGKLVIGTGLGVGTGASIIVSQLFGAHDERRLSDALHTTVALGLMLGVLLSIAGVLGTEQLLRLLGTPYAAMGDVRTFAYAYLGAAMLPLLFNLGTGLQRAVGNVRAFARSAVLVLLVTAGLDFLLVTKLGLGACGAAYASIGAYLLGTILTFYELRRAPRSWRLHLSRIRFIPRIALDILVYTLPLLIQSAAFALSDGSVLTYVSSFGPQMVEAWELALRIGSLIALVASALSMATITFSAQNFGAGNYSRMRQGLHGALRLGIFAIGGISVIVCLLAQSIAVVATRDTTTIALCTAILLATTPSYMLCSCAEGIVNTVRGAGESWRPTLLLLIGACASRVAWFVLAVPQHHSVVAAFVAYPLTGALALALVLPYWRHGRWLERSLERARYLHSHHRRKR